MKALCISAIASNQGKTIVTMALLKHFEDSVRPFKIGPDFIDPQFHTLISKTPSVNLDTFMMSQDQVKWMFQHYSDKNISICEGVMGFYDGMDKGSSAYDISKLLNIPTLLILDGGSSYITVSAVLQGLLTYKEDNTIRAVLLNNISSQGHFELIKKQLNHDFAHIKVVGWIEKNLPSLKEIHLGLDLRDTAKITQISQEVLKHIDLSLLLGIAQQHTAQKLHSYPFKKISKIEKKLAVIHDENFSFLYHDNVEFFKEMFKEVVFVSPAKNEQIPEDTDTVFIPGGYVETPQAYKQLRQATEFKSSLIRHAQNKSIYAECAGLLYLGKSVDEKEMSAVLDMDFTMHKRFQRIGYYHTDKSDAKGHAFHYSDVKYCNENAVDILFKNSLNDGRVGSWQKKKVFGTYLHSMFRSNTHLLQTKFV